MTFGALSYIIRCHLRLQHSFPTNLAQIKIKRTQDQWKCGLTHGKSSYFPALSLVEHKNLNSQDSKGSKLAGFRQQLLHRLPFRRERGKDQTGISKDHAMAMWALYHYYCLRKNYFSERKDILSQNSILYSHEQTMFSRDHLRNWRLIKLREMTIYDQNGFHLHFVRPSIDFTFQLWTARGQLWPRERASNEPGSQ